MQIDYTYQGQKEKLIGNYEIEWEEKTTPKNLSKVFIKADIESQRKRSSLLSK